MPTENSCEYGGVKYSEGSEICQGGRMMVCQGGRWNPTGASCFAEDEGKAMPASIEESAISHNEVKESGPQPFICINCGRQIGTCNGGNPGERHVWCSSPGGHCRCPYCSKEYYEISHTHGW